MSIIFILLQWLAVIILFVVLVLMFLWMANFVKSKSPFIPIPMSTLKDVEKVLGINENSVVYDLGCGDGRIIFYLSKLHPKARFVGIENGTFPLFLANVGFILNKKRMDRKIKIIQNDFFKEDLSEATHIFTYLRPEVMDDLLTKFDKELKSGTKLVSLYFQFTLKRPIAEVNIDKKNQDKKLFIYEF